MHLNRAERSGALMVLGLFALGAAWDLWQIHRPPPKVTDAGPAPIVASAPAPAIAGDPVVAPPAPPGTAVPNRIDLNRADAAELDQLPGIGPVLASRIVEHRRQAGPYRSVEELLAVRGIGPALLGRLRDRVRVDMAASGSGEMHDRGSSTP